MSLLVVSKLDCVTVGCLLPFHISYCRWLSTHRLIIVFLMEIHRFVAAFCESDHLLCGVVGQCLCNTEDAVCYARIGEVHR